MKKIISVLLAVVMVLGLAACGGSSSSSTSTTTAAAPAATSSAAPAAQTETKAEAAPAEAAFDKEYTWSFATTYGTGTISVDYYNYFAELLSDYTDGKVQLTIFADGSIATEDDSVYQVSAGELEFFGSSTAPVFLYSNDSQWIIAPFLISDIPTYYKLWNESDYWQGIHKLWEDEYNCKDLVGCMWRGFRTLVTTKPCHELADLKGLKLRMNSNKMWAQAWETLGCNTVAISLGELYTSLQTGVAEACENPLCESGALNVPELAECVVKTNHVTECICIYMDNDLFNSLPANYQEAVIKAGTDAKTKYEAEAEAQDQGWLKTYQDNGAEVVDIDLAPIKEASAGYWEKMFNTEWTGLSYADAMALIEECSK